MLAYMEAVEKMSRKTLFTAESRSLFLLKNSLGFLISSADEDAGTWNICSSPSRVQQRFSAKGHDSQGDVGSVDQGTRPETGHDEIVVWDPLMWMEDRMGAKATAAGGIVCPSRKRRGWLPPKSLQGKSRKWAWVRRGKQARIHEDTGRVNTSALSRAIWRSMRLCFSIII